MSENDIVEPVKLSLYNRRFYYFTGAWIALSAIGMLILFLSR